ncbi:lissencephaly type-1-like motif-containing protein [Cavenderia fasciculata]|uniref:Lissencephaly type-1-like motif-containing protein n=1 Tax=Cavenderia fasciculata TaxID=261658 RepID=F4PKU1_CACFS|nr:lissencephaly type-1-like motif-containing protein [Cavenderia fasciculata]EGG24215.1 lissencephaly type-1-like motif-containing protein [Cavenderia fasciculata]|eukprot:XP_004362066.1 lissencephaly type-1-like motif-containing protein [Cavenderia fasciculata]
MEDDNEGVGTGGTTTASSSGAVTGSTTTGGGGGHKHSNLSEEIQLERPLLKAPVEQLNKLFRNTQKSLEKEMTVLVNTINDMNKRKDTITKDEVSTTIDKLLNKMNNLKRKIEETKNEEEGHLKRMKARLDHLKDANTNQQNPHQRDHFNSVRVDRVLIDYLLREGYYNTAIKLASTGKITELSDIDLFVSSKKVIDGLTKHDCTEALAWCNDNKSKLKKINSTLEFNLRIQEFVEMVRQNKLGAAISYSRQHLSPNASTNMKEIQRAMATLAFRKDTSCERYKYLFDEMRWTDLINQFKVDNYNINSLTLKSLLTITFKSGLSVLKTESCGCTESRNINCPVCDKDFKKLAKPLPISLQSHSSLICRISGEVMDEHNPPLVLPNGQLYCKNALDAMAEANEGVVTCPKTGKSFDYSQLRKAFIS